MLEIGQHLASGDPNQALVAFRHLDMFRDVPLHRSVRTENSSLTDLGSNRYRSTLFGHARWQFVSHRAGTAHQFVLPLEWVAAVHPGQAVAPTAGHWGVAVSRGADSGAILETAAALTAEHEWQAVGSGREGNLLYGTGSQPPYPYTGNQESVHSSLLKASAPEFFSALSLTRNWFHPLVIRRVRVNQALSNAYANTDIGSVIRMDVETVAHRGSYFAALEDAGGPQPFAPSAGRLGIAAVTPGVDVALAPANTWDVGTVWYTPIGPDLTPLTTELFQDAQARELFQYDNTMRGVLQAAQPGKLAEALNALAGPTGRNDGAPNLGGLRSIPVTQTSSTMTQSDKFPLPYGSIPYAFIRDDGKVCAVLTEQNQPIGVDTGATGAVRITAESGNLWDPPVEPPVMDTLPYARITDGSDGLTGRLIVADFICGEYLDMSRDRFGV